MDPFSVVGGCIGLLASVTSLIQAIAPFILTLRDAKDDMRAFRTELYSLSLCVESLRDDAGDPGVNFPGDIGQCLHEVIKNCDAVVAEMHALLQKLGFESARRRIYWVNVGKIQMDRLRSHLEAHKAALSLGVSVTSHMLLSRVDSNTSAIRDDTNHIINEIASLKRRISVFDPSKPKSVTDATLHRFLDRYKTYYTESILSKEDTRPKEIVSITEALPPESPSCEPGEAHPEKQPPDKDDDKAGTHSPGLGDGHLFSSPKISFSEESNEPSERAVSRSSQGSAAKRVHLSAMKRLRLDKQLRESLLKGFPKGASSALERETLLLVREQARAELETAVVEGADPNLMLTIPIDNKRNGRVTAMSAAIWLWADDAERLVPLFLEHGAKVNAEDQLLGTALSTAVSCQLKSVAQLLLTVGANANQKYTTKGLKSLTASWFNSTWGGSGCSLTLRNYSDRQPSRDTARVQTALHAAAALPSVEIVQLLLDYGADVDAVDPVWGTPLHYAAEFDQVKVLRLLILRGADVNRVAGIRGTALHTAAFYDSDGATVELLDKGADPNIVAGVHLTPYFAAEDLEGGENDLQKLFVRWGARTNIEGVVFGRALRDLYKSEGSGVAARRLLKSGARVLEKKAFEKAIHSINENTYQASVALLIMSLRHQRRLWRPPGVKRW